MIHVVPRGYVLDGSEGVKNPVGLAARKVTMRAHVVSGAVSSIQNLLRAVEDCGVEVLQRSCSSRWPRPRRACSTPTASPASSSSTWAAARPTSRPSTGARSPIPPSSPSAARASPPTSPTASRSRNTRPRSSSSATAPSSPDTVDPVAAVKLDDRHYNASFMSQILEYRAREVFDYVRDSLEAAPVEDLLPGGVVLTGGGSLLDGMTDLAEEILGMRARTASPAPRQGRG